MTVAAPGLAVCWAASGAASRSATAANRRAMVSRWYHMLASVRQGAGCGAQLLHPRAGSLTTPRAPDGREKGQGSGREKREREHARGQRRCPASRDGEADDRVGDDDGLPDVWGRAV